ncbi:hypothetical protein CCYA_CCYA19G4719 [Cyanidiococcus yangmingshanensis]|nr:hypothetical protein CCYA_CCYA19G4719 [Cyanidiococcus yangmingshanensis]
MGLLTVIRKQKRRDRELRILVLGLDNAGKTTIVRRLLGDDEAAVRQTAPTQGFCIRTKVLVSGYRMHFWDIGGQRSLRAYWRNYFERTDALIWVVDATDPQRAREEAAAELAALLSEPSLQRVPLLVLANKSDLAAARPPQAIGEALGLSRPVPSSPTEGLQAPTSVPDATTETLANSTWAQAWPAHELNQLESKRSWYLASCSAYTGQGLDNSLNWLLQQVAWHLYRFDSRREPAAYSLVKTLNE